MCSPLSLPRELAYGFSQASRSHYGERETEKCQRTSGSGPRFQSRRQLHVLVPIAPLTVTGPPRRKQNAHRLEARVHTRHQLKFTLTGQ
jgi:hypothetical protein